MQKIYILLIIAIIFVAGCGESTDKQANNIVADNRDKQEGITIIKNVFNYRTSLVDVSGGQASGLARANFAEGVYILEAKFENLPKPQGNDFYEGWLVRKQPLSVISVGKVAKKEGVYINTYISEQDLIDHNFYVLTLESDDNNSDPARHVLEGALEKVDNS